MIRQRQGIQITEVWSRNSWQNFDIYEPVTTTTALGREPSADIPFSLATQRHVDLRTFTEGSWAATRGTITPGSLAGFNNASGATIFAPIGTSIYTSNYLDPVDLTSVGSTAHLRLTVPDFPTGSVTTATSSLQLSSNNWITTLTLPWNASVSDPAGGYLSFPYSGLTNIDPSNVTNVRLVVTTTIDATFHVMALRLVHDDWVPTNVDYNNLEGRIQRSIPLNGISAAYPNNQLLPVVWRSSEVAGIDDPRPINAEMSFIFHTGSQLSLNNAYLYMRESTKLFVTQAALNGTPQSELTGRPQPVEGDVAVSPRPMSDFDVLTMEQLQSESMRNLEATSNPEFSSWIRFGITWGPVETFVQITNSSQPLGFQYTGLSFANNTSYVAICNLTDGTARMQIFTIDQDTLAISDLIFDTTVIPDDFFFPRRSGRLGLELTFGDGDAWVGAVRPRGLMFAEYRSKPLQSITPVRGAHLYAQHTPPLELFSSWSPLSDDQNLPTTVGDQQRYLPTNTTKTSTRVTIIKPSSTLPPQGIVSNVLSRDTESGITDFDQLHVEFSLWVPSAALDGGTFDDSATVLRAALFNATPARGLLRYPSSTLYPHRSIVPGFDFSAMGYTPFVLPRIIPDQWQTISIFRPLQKPYPQSGPYRLALFYFGATPTTFWIDGTSIRQDVVRWDARSVVDDAWHSNYAPWTIFHETMNSDLNQVGFTSQGSDLQIRAQGLAQNTTIVGAPKVVPQYAELGRMVWPEDKYKSAGAPSAAISSVHTGRSYTFTATSVTSPNGIGDYQWSLGDGTFGSGPQVVHEYPGYLAPGTEFTVYLTVYDRAGLNFSTSVTFALT